MLVRRDLSYFGLLICGLIALWVFFGCLEFGESLEILTEIVSDGQDLDEQALLQLTLGLKSNLSNDESHGATSVPVVGLTVLDRKLPAGVRPHQLLRFRSPPSRPLYQQLSVYRI